MAEQCKMAYDQVQKAGGRTRSRPAVFFFYLAPMDNWVDNVFVGSVDLSIFFVVTFS